MRPQARASSAFQLAFAPRPRVSADARPNATRLPAFSPRLERALWLTFAGSVAIVALAAAVILLTVRASYAERIFPAVTVADVAVGGLPMDVASARIAQRAAALESSTITLTHDNASWSATLGEIGVSVDEQAALADAARIGREESALQRLRSTSRAAANGTRVALPIAVDYQQLDRWFDEIDRELGSPPHDASIAIDGANVSIVPEVDGTVVDRPRARTVITRLLQHLEPVQADLPVQTKIAAVRAADLEPARALLAQAIAQPLQVASDTGAWTLPGAEIAQFVDQKVTAGQGGAPAIALSLDREKLAPWLSDRLAAQINREPTDAVVGWNGERVVSVEPSVDGVRLDAAKLAEEVEGRFFGGGGTITAPVTYIKPKIDSGNLDALGITTLLGSGQSNYSGSNDGRATNVAVGARLLNGTLIPPWGEFSFNGAIGLIDEEQGFVEAQVIDGENIGQDIGGGICQVSTTVFRAAYLAGLPITEWWPHRFRIGFYEYDGWKPGLDASILQPTTDPSTWADFKFENPSDSWMLVESWTDGVNVIVNIYGADLGYQVETTGPTWGAKTQMLPPSEVVDDKLDPGTIEEVQIGGIGEELSHYRVVRDRNGQVLWEGNFYTKYFPRGEVWKVSADMKGQAPIDKSFKAPPLPPAGIDSHNWTPGMDVSQLPSTATEGAIWTSG
ncbi:MAG: VanW family protein [Thermomicrobiales bacterium]|nr:VanW family protein [Thermomicrobiales bacterium]